MEWMSTIGMLVVMLAIFYFLLIRPENKKKKELAKMRREKGIDYILENVSKLDLNGPVAKEIKAAVETLKQKGWIRE